LAFGSSIGLRIWETRTWTEIFAAKRPQCLCVAWTPDRQYLLVGAGKKLKVLKFGTWKNILTFDDDDQVKSILIASADGKRVIISGHKGSKVWQLDLP
jgi:hypothetical protein